MSDRGSTYSDQQLIDGLLAGGERERFYLKQLYLKYQQMVDRYVVNNSGNADDAADVFQDGIIILYKNIKSRKFNAESSIKTYLYAICRHLWLKKLKQAGSQRERLASLERIHEEDPYISMMLMEQQHQVLELFDRVGSTCKEVLLLAYYRQYSMDEIAQAMGYQSAQIARNKKFKCLSRLKELVQENKAVRDLLTG